MKKIPLEKRLGPSCRGGIKKTTCCNFISIVENYADRDENGNVIETATATIPPASLWPCLG